jgi:D-tyrosyl-tRNA(Tyr) deacylase
MRAVIQRVTNAKVEINNRIKAQISVGLLVFLGVEEADTLEDVTWLSQKICNLRIFSDEKGLMNLALKDLNAEVLLISQFTLFALTQKGNRPSFINAAKPEHANVLYEKMKEELGHLLNKDIQSGEFGANMKVSLLNDGPVTIIMDTKDKERH